MHSSTTAAVAVSSSHSSTVRPRSHSFERAGMVVYDAPRSVHSACSNSFCGVQAGAHKSGNACISADDPHRRQTSDSTIQCSTQQRQRQDSEKILLRKQVVPVRSVVSRRILRSMRLHAAGRRECTAVCADATRKSRAASSAGAGSRWILDSAAVDHSEHSPT